MEEFAAVQAQLMETKAEKMAYETSSKRTQAGESLHQNSKPQGGSEGAVPCDLSYDVAITPLCTHTHIFYRLAASGAQIPGLLFFPRTGVIVVQMTCPNLSSHSHPTSGSNPSARVRRFGVQL
jgi:hypothetical protein